MTAVRPEKLLGLWRRPPDRDAERDLARLEEVRGVLEEARDILARGWVQDDFFLVVDRRGRIVPADPLHLGLMPAGSVVGACLVGALVHGARTLDPRLRDAGHLAAVDAAWEALQEVQSGEAGATRPASSPAQRAGRVRDLTRWNDAPGRSQGEVLRLLDVAVSRSILAAVTR